jgi:hypothetical protein
MVLGKSIIMGLGYGKIMSAERNYYALAGYAQTNWGWLAANMPQSQENRGFNANDRKMLAAIHAAV